MTDAEKIMPIWVEITPSMVEAGVYAVKEVCLGEGLEAIVRAAYLAMRTEEIASGEGAVARSQPVE